jgi:hypothetical protein
MSDHRDLATELEDLAGEIDPATKRPRFLLLTHEEAEARPPAPGEVRFTLHVDRRDDDDAA